MTHWIAKIGGWAQFALQLAAQVAQNTPHGWQSWLTMAGSLLAAVGIHAASSTDGKQ